MTIGKAATVDERVKLYLAKTPPAIDGENGHGHTFGVVCRVFELFDISTNSDDEILALLADWNARCEPPWTEKELCQKFNSARDKVNSQGNANVNDGDEVEWPTLGEDALYGIAGEYVQTTGPASECGPVALLVTFLTVFGNVIGRNANFPVGGDFHHANLFVCLVGSSSRARKGTSLGYVNQAFNGIDTA